jgi:hypothetical protein
MGKLLKRIGAGLLGLFALGFVYWFLTAPTRSRKATAISAATAVTAEASKAAAQDTVKIIVENQAARGRIDVITQGNRDAILAAPGATAPLDADLHHTGLRALCLRDVGRVQPACKRLLDPGAEAGGGPDAERAVP